jgi:hypothetical protein
MRSPPEVPYLYALETAMDELAVALAMDPVELRRRDLPPRGQVSRNDTQRDPITGKPYRSRSLMRRRGWRQPISRSSGLSRTYSRAHFVRPAWVV